MDVILVQEVSLMGLKIDPNIEFFDALTQHLPPIAIYLGIAFMVRRQMGGGWVAFGVALLLFRELFCIFVHYDGAYSALELVGPDLLVPLMYGTLILGFGFVGIGIMQPHQNPLRDATRMARCLKALLIASITIELGLLINRLSINNSDALVNSIHESFHLTSLTLFVAVIGLRQYHDSKIPLETAEGQRQLDAMTSMFSAVKHDLNNDMQVVVGNAELAEILINSGSDVEKPISNISSAASIAIERIEQLSVFNATARPALLAIDLNAVLRQSMAKLVNEVPAIVTLKMELSYLPVRVMADRYLLSLSLTHMIRRALKNMQYGGEIVIRTQDMSATRNRQGNAVINAEVFIVRVLAPPVGDSQTTKPLTHAEEGRNELECGVATTKSLVERSGAISVVHSLSPDEYLFTMEFISEASVVEPVSAHVTARHSFVRQ